MTGVVNFSKFAKELSRHYWFSETQLRLALDRGEFAKFRVYNPETNRTKYKLNNESLEKAHEILARVFK